MWQKFFVTPTPTTTQDDRSDPYMSPPLKRAGDTIIQGEIISTIHNKVLILALCSTLHIYLLMFQVSINSIQKHCQKKKLYQNFNQNVDAARPPYRPTPIYWPKFLLKNELSINMNITSNLETLSKTNKTIKTYIICNKLELKPSFSTQAIKYFPHFKNLSLWWAKNCFINLFL